MGKDALAELQFKTAMDTAVRILTLRGHSAHELSLKLRKRRIRETIVAQVVVECMRLNYIDDAETARRYVEELKSKGYGRRHVSSAMQKKGLAADIVAIALEEGYFESEEKAIAVKMLEKKKETFTREKDRHKRKGKIYRYLYARGFSPEIISAVTSSWQA